MVQQIFTSYVYAGYFNILAYALSAMFHASTSILQYAITRTLVAEQ